jgi:hypothetical protein
MRSHGLSVLDGLVFFMVASLANSDTLVVHDNIEALAQWCAMPPRAVVTSLAALARLGMLERAGSAPCPCHGAPSLLRIRRYDEWARTPKPVVTAARVQP